MTIEPAMIVISSWDRPCGRLMNFSLSQLLLLVSYGGGIINRISFPLVLHLAYLLHSAGIGGVLALLLTWMPCSCPDFMSVP